MRGSSSRHVDDRRLGERLEPLLTQLGPDAGLLRAGVGDVRSEVEMLVHPDRAGIDPGRHSERPVAGLITSTAPAPETSLPSINNLKLRMTYPSLSVLVVCRLTDRAGRVIPRPSASATAARRRGSGDRCDEP